MVSNIWRMALICEFDGIVAAHYDPVKIYSQTFEQWQSVEALAKGYKVNFRKYAFCNRNQIRSLQWANSLADHGGHGAVFDSEIERFEKAESIFGENVRYSAHAGDNNQVSTANSLKITI